MEQTKLSVCLPIEKAADISFFKKPGVTSYTCATCGFFPSCELSHEMPSLREIFVAI